MLGGGGAKAAAQVGALKALEETDRQPSRFVGTSMGAVIGACYACGMSYHEVLRRVTGITRGAVASLSPSVLLGPFAEGLLKRSSLESVIATLVPARRFRDLRKPLTVTAVDDRSGDLVLFGEGGRDEVPLVDALYASCALPVLYPPKRIGGRRYVDGGLRSVLPLKVARSFDPDLIFAVSTGPSFHAVPPEASTTPPLLGAHNNAMRLLMAAQTRREIEEARTWQVPLALVEPRLMGAMTFALDCVTEFVEEGYRAAYRVLHSAEFLD